MMNQSIISFCRPRILQSTAKADKYAQLFVQHSGDFVWIGIPLVSISFFISCILIPCLLHNMRGVSKAYLVLQQLSANVFLIKLVILMVPYRNKSRDLTSFVSGGYTWSFTEFSENIGNVCFYQQFFYSVLQSLNFYHMICKPLKFAEYSKNWCVVCRVAFISIVSIVLNVPKLIESVMFKFASTWVFSQIESYLQVRRFNSVYNAVVLILLRIGYTTILSMIAVKVRSSLAESRGVREGKNNHPLFIAICIVPLINNILYLGSDIPQLIRSYRDITYSDMDRLNKFYADWRLFECRFILTTAVYLTAAVIQCSAYLLCFPQLRRCLCESFAKDNCAK